MNSRFYTLLVQVCVARMNAHFALRNICVCVYVCMCMVMCACVCLGMHEFCVCTVCVCVLEQTGEIPRDWKRPCKQRNTVSKQERNMKQKKDNTKYKICFEKGPSNQNQVKKSKRWKKAGKIQHQNRGACMHASSEMVLHHFWCNLFRCVHKQMWFLPMQGVSSWGSCESSGFMKPGKQEHLKPPSAIDNSSHMPVCPNDQCWQQSDTIVECLQSVILHKVSLNKRQGRDSYDLRTFGMSAAVSYTCSRRQRGRQDVWWIQMYITRKHSSSHLNLLLERDAGGEFAILIILQENVRRAA